MSVFIEMSIIIEVPSKSVEEAATSINDHNGKTGKLEIKTIDGKVKGEVLDYHIKEYYENETDDDDENDDE
jgi:hypothetical protein